MKNFTNYTSSNNKGILTIETDDSEFREEWLLTIDISQIWQAYDKGDNSLLDFNNQYATLLIGQQQKICSIIGEQAWNEIEPVVINELRECKNEEESEKIYNKLYDIFDRYEIEIKVDTKENLPETPAQQIQTAVKNTPLPANEMPADEKNSKKG